jgi:hypothetical protein
MRRPTVLVPLDRTMQLPLTLAGGLRTTFADVVSSPLSGRLAALVSRLEADRNETLRGKERKLDNPNRNVEPYFVEDDNHRMRKRRSRAANRRA